MKRNNSQKLASSLLAGLLIFNLFSFSTAFAADFSDVKSNHRNYKAINFLRENKIIAGYEDGTFRPNNKVNRVEFLKIVLESSGIELDSNEETGFKDIDENAWYSPYLKKAKSEKWINGYDDGSFRPGQKINKAEALKIIAEVQKWQLKESSEIQEDPYDDAPKTAWYVAYLDFAKSKEVLSKNKKKILPGQLLTRADVASLLFNTIEKKVSNFQTKTVETTEVKEEKKVEAPKKETTVKSDKPATKAEDLNFKPVKFRNQSKGSFQNILLDNNFPNHFYKNELYYFEGQLSNIQKGKVLFFILDEKNGKKEYKNYIAKVAPNKTFSIPVIFKETGNFKIGIIPGTQGTSTVKEISILPSLPELGEKSSNQAPSNTKIVFNKDKTSFHWNKNGNNIFKVNIWQNNNLVTYFNRQNKSSIEAIYSDFAKFKKGTAHLEVEGAQASSTKPLEFNTKWAKSSQKNFQITQHLKSDIDTKYITLNGFKEALIAPKKMTVTGTFKINSIDEAAIIKPDGFVERVHLKSSSPTFDNFSYTLLPKNAKFTLEYTPKTTGTYILEINKENGAASVNTPIYIGTAIPLIPDYFDLEDGKLSKSPINLKNAREELLNYVNKARLAHGFKKVSIDPNLNTLAQLHTNDMAKNNYFSHIDLEGKSPSDRRKELGILTEVGENLGKAPSVRYGHEGLMRSAIHRDNILDPAWTTIGLGITKDEDGYLYIAEEFSHEAYSEQDLTDFENELADALNQKRVSIGLNSVVKNPTLDKIAEALTSDLIENKSITTATLRDHFVANKLEQKLAFVLNGNSPNNTRTIEETTKGIDSSHKQWNEIGVNYTLDAFGTLIFVILYTN